MTQCRRDVDFEPHVAEKIFNDMVAEAESRRARRTARPERTASTDGTHIVAIMMESGETSAARCSSTRPTRAT